LFVKATGKEKEILQIKSELEKKLFQTELKDGTLIGKFTGEYIVVLDRVRWLDKEGCEF